MVVIDPTPVTKLWRLGNRLSCLLHSILVGGRPGRMSCIESEANLLEHGTYGLTVGTPQDCICT